MKRLSISLAFVLLVGCGSYQTVTQSDGLAYIQFVGGTQDETLLIDGQTSGTLGVDLESFDLNGVIVTKIQLPPGTHEVELSRSGETIVHRKIYVSEGNIFEVIIP